MESHKRIIVQDGKGGPPRVVYQRTKETEEAIHNHRLGEYWNTPPLQDRDFRALLGANMGIFIGEYLVCRMALRAKLDIALEENFRVINGTQILSEFLKDAKEDFLNGYPHDRFVAVMYGFTESTNRRVPDLIKELIGTRYQRAMDTWIFFPKNITLMAEQWGPSLLDLTYISQYVLPKTEGGIVLNSSSGVNAAHEQRKPWEPPVFQQGNAAPFGDPGIPKMVEFEDPPADSQQKVDRKLRGKKDKPPWERR